MSIEHFASSVSMVSELQRDPLVRAHEAIGQGRRVVGYIGADVPVELILAADALPIRLRGASNAPTPLANQYLESSFAPEIRAIAEQWLSGALDGFDAVIFPRSDDSAQRLYYYVCELRRNGKCGGPSPLLFDVSTIARSSSARHTLDATQRLANELSTSLNALPAAIARAEKRRAIKQRIQSARGHATIPLSSAIYEVLTFMDCDWSDALDAHIDEWLKSARLISPTRRLLFAGNAPPDARIHRAVESANAAIVAECIDHIHTNAIDVSNATIEAIAHRHHMGRSLAQQMLSSPRMLASCARDLRADGVILWAIEEDEALPWEISRQANALHASHIPVLSLTRQEWLSHSSTLESISHFALTLEAGK